MLPAFGIDGAPRQSKVMPQGWIDSGELRALLRAFDPGQDHVEHADQPRDAIATP
jgi:hypothetical protein